MNGNSSGEPASASSISTIDHSITDEDIAAIGPVFWRKPKDISRRCQQAWLNRLKRVAAAVNINEANLLVLDFVWGNPETSFLWQRLSPEPYPAWKTKSKPWDFLIQYIFRTDISNNIVERAQALRKCKQILPRFQQDTGYRITFVEGTTETARTRAIKELFETASHWFSHVGTITDQGLLVRKIEEVPVSFHQPLQAPPHELPILMNRSMVGVSIQKLWPSGQFRFLKIYADPPGYPPRYATQFLPWKDENYATNSGMILVGGQDERGGPLELFLINTHTWEAHYAGVLVTSKSTKTVLASHHANLSAVYRTVTGDIAR